MKRRLLTNQNGVLSSAVGSCGITVTHFQAVLWLWCLKQGKRTVLPETDVSHASQAPLPLLSTVCCLTLSVFLCNCCLCIMLSRVTQPDCTTFFCSTWRFRFPYLLAMELQPLFCYLAPWSLSNQKPDWCSIQFLFEPLTVKGTRIWSGDKCLSFSAHMRYLNRNKGSFIFPVMISIEPFWFGIFHPSHLFCIIPQWFPSISKNGMPILDLVPCTHVGQFRVAIPRTVFFPGVGGSFRT